MRNVVVTGGSRGLGLAISRQLAGCGYRVVAIARNSTEALDTLMRGPGPGAVHFWRFDLADTAEIPRLVREIRREFGPVWGLVNNAAIGTSGMLANMTVAQIEQLLTLNTLSPILLSKQVVRGMLADGAKGGRIVNLGSIVGSTGFSGLSVYSATKGAIVSFSKALAREVGRLGVTVNVVAPGFVDTAMTEGLEGAQREQIVRRSPLHRLAEAEDVAATVEFLMGDKGRNITGTVLTVDAGSTA
jgi:3-oxoacyl-[acyl-carrier protein] reductase